MKTKSKVSSLILALVLVCAASTGATIIYNYSANQAYMAKRTLDLLKARSIAESGIIIAYSKLKNDISLSYNNSWTKEEFDEGTYQIIPNIITSNRITLLSIG